jgi:hypothetical protein
MAEYYSQASCCVVVSEMLHRRYSHLWEDRGIDDKYELELPEGAYMGRNIRIYTPAALPLDEDLLLAMG